MAGCKSAGVKRHPARFPSRFPEFFIKFLTEPEDLVLDIFAGSNTTGQVAEKLSRNWLSFEQRLDYVSSSAFRFTQPEVSEESLVEIYQSINSNKTIDFASGIYAQKQKVLKM